MNILYIDIDSLRPDHLGCYGYHRDTSPHIDAIAADGLRFENVYASDVPCHPSRTALWSGRHGYRTGVVGHGGTAAEPYREGAERGFNSAYLTEGWMWALRQLGYHTASVSSFGERHGCWHWYAGYNELINPGQFGLETADRVTALARQWITRQDSGKPWFLHVNLWDPHTPYRTPEDFGDPFADTLLPGWLTEDVLAACMNGYGPHSALEPNGYGGPEDDRFRDNPRAPAPIDSMARVRAWIDGYDTGIAYADVHIGHLLDELRERGLYDKTIVVISADHGENLGELNIWGDHQTADRFTGNVPLIMRWPADPAFRGVDRRLHYHFDWPATLIGKLGGEVPDSWDGRPFDVTPGSAATGPGAGGREYLVIGQGAWACQRGVRFDRGDRQWLLISTLHDGHKALAGTMLFNLTDDPHQQHDCVAAHPDIAGFGKRLLDDWLSDIGGRSPAEHDPLQTVIAEGGPYHCRGQLPAYLHRLRRTGRARHAEALAIRHPGET